MTLMKTTKSNSGFWYIGDFRVAVSNQEAQMRTSFVDLTPLGYSYHCYPKTNISAVNGSSIYVVFNNYQVARLRKLVVEAELKSQQTLNKYHRI
jgi:hypothetical protein